MAEPYMEYTLETILTSVRRGPEVWTPRCIDTEDMIGLVEHGGKYPGAPELLDHMVACNFCTRTYKDLRESLLEEQAATAEYFRSPKVSDRISPPGAVQAQQPEPQQASLKLMSSHPSEVPAQAGLTWKPGDEDTYLLLRKSGDLFSAPVDNSLQQTLGAQSASRLRWEADLPLPRLNDASDGLICYLTLQQEADEHFLQMSLGMAQAGAPHGSEVEITIARLSQKNKPKEPLQAQVAVGGVKRQSVPNYSKKETWTITVKLVQRISGNGF